MSKSLDNYIGIAEPPKEMFGKLMSISDELMWRYTSCSPSKPWRRCATGQRKWRQGAIRARIKVLFAKEIVARFHSRDAANRAEEEFGKAPQELENFDLSVPQGGLQVTHALKLAGFVPSVTEAQRVIEQGGVRIDGERLSDMSKRFSSGASITVQVGKRKFGKITFK